MVDRVKPEGFEYFHLGTRSWDGAQGQFWNSNFSVFQYHSSGSGWLSPEGLARRPPTRSGASTRIGQKHLQTVTPWFLHRLRLEGVGGCSIRTAFKTKEKGTFYEKTLLFNTGSGAICFGICPGPSRRALEDNRRHYHRFK